MKIKLPINIFTLKLGGRFGRLLDRRFGGMLLFLFLTSFIGGMFPAISLAQEKSNKKPDSKVPKELPEIDKVEKTRAMVIRAKEITYKIVFDCIPVKTDSLPTYTGRMCYNAYLLDDNKANAKKEKTDRPVTFFFNGGPGAASVYLNFGVAGPRIISPRIDSNNFIYPTATPLTDNPHTWLDRSDLVFIDPVGTGFSYVVPKDNNTDERKALRDFWGVHEDLQSISHFIRLWITDNNRWMSPKVIAGESYGGLRTAALANYLINRTGISPDGVVMVSPALDLRLITDKSTTSLSPWLSVLPSFIHTARHYHKGSLSPLPPGDNLEERIEQYLLGEYLPQIARGNSLSREERKNFYENISRLIGVSPAFVAKQEGLIGYRDYSKNILADRGMVLSIYDGTIAYPDPHPRSWYYGQDAYLDTISAAFHTAANHYYRDELDLNSLREFHSLNFNVNSSWKYPGNSSSLESFSDLEQGLIANPQMEALIVHGRHDFVTPYYVSKYLINRSTLPQIKARVRLRLYDGGHMFYLNRKSLEEFDDDIREFYQRIEKKGK